MIDDQENCRRSYYPSIDGVRAIAVVSVILFHLNEQVVPGGSTGVDMFFVISGFVVTLSNGSYAHDSLINFLKTFYVRRFFRIYPALAAMSIATTVLYALFIPSAWLSSEIGRTDTAALFGFSNLVLAQGSDYFSPIASYNPFTHTWSLGVEEQFYAVFPFIIYFGHKLAGRFPRVDLPLVSISALTFASLAIGFRTSADDPTRAFYLLPSRFWELGAGMMLCRTMPIWRRRVAGAPRLPPILGAASCAMLAVSLSIKPASGFPVPFGLLPVLGTAGLIAVAVAAGRALLSRGLSLPAAIWLGRRSYSLYLWHWPVIVGMRWTSGLSTLPQYAAAVALTLALAGLSFGWLEERARRLPQRLPSPARLVGAIALSILAVTAGVRSLLHAKPYLILGSTRDVATWYPSPAFSDSERLGCRIGEQRRSMSGTDVVMWTPEGCPIPTSEGQVFVAGDSHALAYGRLLSRYALRTGRRVTVYSLPGCAMIDLLPRAPSPSCATFQRVVADDIAGRVSADDAVFLPSLRVFRFTDQWGDIAQAEPTVDALDVVRAASTLMQVIELRKPRVVFEAPLPLFRAPLFRCSDWFNRDNPACRPGFSMDRDLLDRHRSFALGAMRSLAAGDDRATIWDPLPPLCPGARCEAVLDKKPLFFDQDHLSGYGNDVLLSSFEALMERVFPNDAPGVRSSQPFGREPYRAERGEDR